MAQSLSQLWVHLIFSTRKRIPYLADLPIRDQVHAYLAGICKKMSSTALMVGGVADHVHILCMVSKDVALSQLVRNLKQDSSKWIKTQWPQLNDFYWQGGYGAFSVGTSQVDKVRAYIANQEAHHHQVGFQDEFRSFLTKNQIDFNEGYVWD